MIRFAKKIVRSTIVMSIIDKIKVLQTHLNDVNTVKSEPGTSLRSDDFTTNISQ